MPREEEAQVPLTISETDQRQVLELYQKIQRSRAKLVGSDGKTQNLPVSLYEFLVRLIANLCEGQSVAIVQNEAQLTTVEGARMLGVSRQSLIKLLERGDIPHHMVGTHRRVYVRDLLDYKARRDGASKKIIEQMICREQEDGNDEMAVRWNLRTSRVAFPPEKKKPPTPIELRWNSGMGSMNRQKHEERPEDD